MATYHDVGQSSGFEPYDMNPQQPAVTSTTSHTKNHKTIPPELITFFRIFQHDTLIAMESAPLQSPDLPPGPEKSAMQAMETKVQSLMQETYDVATYALDHPEADLQEVVERFEKARDGLRKYQKCMEDAQRDALEDDGSDGEEEDPISPEAMRKLQGVVKDMRKSRLPSYEDPEKQLKVDNLMEEMLSATDTLDEAATYALENGEIDREGALKKLRDAYRKQIEFQSMFNRVRDEVDPDMVSNAERMAAIDQYTRDHDALLAQIHESFDTMLQDCPPNETGTDDPETLQLNSSKDDLRAFVAEYKEDALYAMEHQGPEGEESREKLAGMPENFQDLVDRMQDYRNSMPSGTLLGFIRYRLSHLSWAKTKDWAWARNKSLLFVALSLFVRAYREGCWTDLANGLTVVMNS